MHVWVKLKCGTMRGTADNNDDELFSGTIVCMCDIYVLNIISYCLAAQPKRGDAEQSWFFSCLIFNWTKIYIRIYSYIIHAVAVIIIHFSHVSTSTSKLFCFFVRVKCDEVSDDEISVRMFARDIFTNKFLRPSNLSIFASYFFVSSTSNYDGHRIVRFVASAVAQIFVTGWTKTVNIRHRIVCSATNYFSVHK